MGLVGQLNAPKHNGNLIILNSIFNFNGSKSAQVSDVNQVLYSVKCEHDGKTDKNGMPAVKCALF